MRKNFTPVTSTPKNNQTVTAPEHMGPNKETLKNIMQFAAAYRVEKVPKNSFVEYFLN
ncbi:MAG: hypothetical protein GX102_00570 [Porphyromonadaceae bacterium]|nr:hypothetical protein [Porphyromonadaceae bacterium]